MSDLIKVLSIDGGGIRGIVPGTILVEAEKAFGFKVWDYFDMIAGTSTGGILSCAYLCPGDNDPSKPKFTSEEVVGLYFERGDEIFDIPIFHKIRSVGGIADEKYPDDGIEDALHDYFGNVWLKDLLKPTVITSYDIKNRKGHFFYQHEAKKDAAYNFRIKDVSRATSAAPTYFECARIRNEKDDRFVLIDGGVFVNNPALAAYAEVREQFDKATAKDMKILSLGTGFSKKKYYYSQAKDWGMAQWVQPVIDIMMAGSVDVNDFYIDQIFDAAGHPNHYLRLNAKMPADVDADMDCATPENMAALKRFGQQIFKENKKDLKEWFGV